MSRIAIVSLAVSALLVGCGSATGDVRSAVSNMQSVISSYNGSHPTTLSATADACRKAYGDLGKSSPILSTSLHGKPVAEQRVLQAAYRSARQGFQKCAIGASSLNFPVLTAAQQEIAAANQSIRRAQKLER